MLEHFNSSKEKAKVVYNSILDKVSELESIRLMVGAGGNKQDDYSETDSLISSKKNAQASIEIARDIESSLSMQMNSLDKIKKKVGDFIGELNIGKSLIRIIGNRSAEDYKLILLLTFILIVEIVVCYFYIRPWIKGN